MDFYKNTAVGKPETYSIKFWFVYVISVVFTFQSLLTAYSSSTYIEQFTAPENVGLLYSLGALIAIAAFFILPFFLKKCGNVVVIIVLMVLSMIALGLIGGAPTTFITLAAFVLFLALNPLIYLNIDIFSETLIGDNEGETGTKRGLALSLMSIAALLSPLAMGYIIGADSENLAMVYFVAIGVGLLFLTIIIGAFRNFYDPPYVSIKIKDLLKQAAKDVDIRIVLIAHFLLQLFFAWIVIYFPLYLATEIGLSWTAIGNIIAVGLLAYVLFEYPTGLLADKYIGEKEMMAIGFVILAISSAGISYVATFGIIGWMVLMFFSRIGASLVEVTTESYFFKKVKGGDANLMSLFRLMRPLASLAGALLGTVALLFLPFELIFIVLGITMLSGVFLTLYITDTK